jgi:uncharacterized delta-60 repeat protein
VVTGEAGYGGSNPKIALARYDVDGSLDTSFSGDGMVKFDLTGDEDYAVDVAIQADGRIVAVGGAGSGGSNPTFGLVRLAADGTLDGTFSGDGKLTTDFTDKTDWAAAVAIQADGRIVAAGESGNGGSNSKFALARYNTDGSLDTTFSGDGKVGANFTSGRDAAFGMKIQTDGKIVAAGGAGEPNTTFAVARFLGA